MKFWQPITWAETDQLIEIARFAEEVGFHGVMSGDHALYPGVMEAGYPYSDSGYPPQTEDSEYPDQWALFGAVAAATTTLRFTCGVYVLPLRNPIEVAKACATLDILSDGRFVLGAGAGWMREEFDIYGIDFKTRGKRLDECLEALRVLWKPELVEYHGDYIDFPPIRLAPAPKNDIPIYIGGANKLALRRAARYGDGWIGAGNTPEEVPQVLAELNQLRSDYGRADRPFDTLIGLMAEPDLAMFQRLAEHGMSSGLNMPFEYALGKGSSLDDKKRMMEQFANRIIRPYS
ncbi:putative F420-dependent oxidoreductase [Litorivivens lipolytica]|uniref:Putative F420-dependent oxidoreductase n=1 Tax=Litorivivens lipolytica TaxID=1524264 RepID=A0A7W4W6B2_9GAMM|nr:LLM class F420-dependent oxidoreductase [Litorivivens lipolytica]MBB3048261.1 putative F420-dependent oxidoreductase [Litorivivens lipolytica]